MRGIHADEQVIKNLGGAVRGNSEGQAVQYQGWRIQANSGPITKDAHMQEFASQVGTSHRLPEQLFGNNALILENEASRLSLSFSALDALRIWHRDNLPPLEVRHAQNWQRTRQKDMEIQNVVTFKYDWTYTTTYNGTCCLREDGQESKEIEWRETEAAMDKSILMQRDPIMFFADIPLYESELDDCGASELSVKVRLMPSCWFVLLRFWLRVDGVMVRLTDTRYLCKFDKGSPKIEREILQYEAGRDLMAKAGSSETHAMAPSGTKFYRTEVYQRHNDLENRQKSPEIERTEQGVKNLRLS